MDVADLIEGCSWCGGSAQVALEEDNVVWMFCSDSNCDWAAAA